MHGERLGDGEEHMVEKGTKLFVDSLTLRCSMCLPYHRTHSAVSRVKTHKFLEVDRRRVSLPVTVEPQCSTPCCLPQCPTRGCRHPCTWAETESNKEVGVRYQKPKGWDRTHGVQETISAPRPALEPLLAQWPLPSGYLKEVWSSTFQKLAPMSPAQNVLPCFDLTQNTWAVSVAFSTATTKERSYFNRQDSESEYAKKPSFEGQRSGGFLERRLEPPRPGCPVSLISRPKRSDGHSVGPQAHRGVEDSGRLRKHEAAESKAPPFTGIWELHDRWEEKGLACKGSWDWTKAKQIFLVLIPTNPGWAQARRTKVWTCEQCSATSHPESHQTLSISPFMNCHPKLRSALFLPRCCISWLCRPIIKPKARGHCAPHTREAEKHVTHDKQHERRPPKRIATKQAQSF